MSRVRFLAKPYGFLQMASEIEADGGLRHGLALCPDFILSYSAEAMARSAPSRFVGRSFSASALS
jgi:hypothetical protein